MPHSSFSSAFLSLSLSLSHSLAQFLVCSFHQKSNLCGRQYNFGEKLLCCDSILSVIAEGIDNGSCALFDEFFRSCRIGRCGRNDAWHTGGHRSLETDNRILDYDTSFARHTQSFARDVVNHRIWLLHADIISSDNFIEFREQRFAKCLIDDLFESRSRRGAAYGDGGSAENREV